MAEDSRVDLGLPTASGDAVAVLFSGGRDSSLVASLLARDGWRIHLVTCDNGVSVGGEVIGYRVHELKRRFPDNVVCHVVIPSFGLFRRVALADIEADFANYKKNLITLGSQLATHATAADRCAYCGRGSRRSQSGTSSR